jgi:hypothetical protein
MLRGIVFLVLAYPTLDVVAVDFSLHDIAWGPFLRHRHYRDLLIEGSISYQMYEAAEVKSRRLRLGFSHSADERVPPPVAIELLVKNQEPHLESEFITEFMWTWDRIQAKTFNRRFVSHPPIGVRLSEGEITSLFWLDKDLNFCSRFTLPQIPIETNSWRIVGEETKRLHRWERELQKQEDRFGRTAFWIEFHFPKRDRTRRRALVTVPPDSLVIEAVCEDIDTGKELLHYTVEDCVEHEGILFPKACRSFEIGPGGPERLEFMLTELRRITPAEKEWYWGAGWPNGTSFRNRLTSEDKVIPFTDTELAAIKSYVAENLPMSKRAVKDYWWIWYFLNVIGVAVLCAVVFKRIRQKAR